jgi:prepilin-type N-terminal cleavage/methylation domain-containing protein
MRKKGFTLAEVLITLSIIGVVAALTIPTVTKNIEKAQCRAAFKKNYAAIAYAAGMIRTDNGDTLAGAFGDSSISDTPFRSEFLKYLPSAKVCTEGTAGCWHGNNVVKYLSPVMGYACNGFDVYANVILSSGALAVFEFDSPTCTSGANNDLCGRIVIDVNGFKGPNVIGKDIFRIWVRKDKIEPDGVGVVPGTANWQCKLTDTGWHCGSAVLQNIDYY